MPLESDAKKASPKRFKGPDMAIVRKSDTEQEEFRAFVNNNSKFSDEEKSTLRIDSVAAFESFWITTTGAKEDFEEAHEHGVKMVMKTARDFASSAFDILQQMDPLLELVKDFGAPYGGMAIGTISFLFAIANNRAKTEARISATLVQIRDRVAGLKVYRHIYNDNHELDQQLQSKIVQTYDNFIGFCIEATKYYCMGGMMRCFRSMGGSSVLMTRASMVQRSIVDVKRMSTELLNKNVDTIKRLNIDQTKRIQDLEADIKRLQDRLAGDRLDKVKELLDLKTYSRESELQLLAKYQTDLNAYFTLYWPHLELLQGNQLQTFKRKSTFQDWIHSEQSCMLILVGYNNDAAYSARECWVSPIALDMIAHLTKPGQPDPYVFYIMGLRDSDPFPRVLSAIILQLLKSNLEALQNEEEYDELLAEIQEYEAAAQERDEYSNKPYSLLQKLALRVINTFDSTRTLWIVLDRVDRCRAGSKFNHRKKLLQTMVHLVDNSKAKVRVLAVVNGYDWQADEQADEIWEESPSKIIIHEARQKSLYD